MAKDTANPILVSNQALQQPQPPSNPIIETTGEIIYANDYAGVSPVAMPQYLIEALNSDYGETGNNIIIQLQQKVQQLPDGPWYVDSRDGVIYIHNKKLQEPPTADYTYQAENGELLSISFETRYITKVLRASTSTGIDQNKGLHAQTLALDQFAPQVTKETYLDYFNFNTGAYNKTGLIRAYARGDVTYKQVLTFNERVKQARGTKRSTFTENEWAQIRAIHHKEYLDKKKKQKEYVNKVYEERMADNTLEGMSKFRQQAIEETLETKDLEANVTEFITKIYSTATPQVMVELEQAAKNGTLDAILKRRFSETQYQFSTKRAANDGGAVVEDWVTKEVKVLRGGITPEQVDRNPKVKTIGYNSRGNISVFTKAPVEATVSGYRLLSAYYTRKYGVTKGGEFNRGILASASNSRKVTERKLNARALVIGRPHLSASQIITLHNVGKKWSGQWYIKACLHKIESGSGYTTELDLVKHKGAEGYSASTETNTHGHNTSGRNNGGSPSSKPLTDIKLTSIEATYFNASTSTEKEDLAILKAAGVQDAVVPKGTMVAYDRTQHIEYKLRRKPTKEERRKYGRAAAKAISGNIKAGIRK